MEPLRESPDEVRIIEGGYFISILLKGLISLIETISGTVLLFIPPSLYLGFLDRLVDFIPFVHLSTQLDAELAQYTAHTAHFVAFYFFIRGIVKLVLIIALLRNKLWAFPFLLAVMGALVLYQLWQIFTTHSYLVIGITLFDLIVMYFVYREWRLVRERLGL